MTIGQLHDPLLRHTPSATRNEARMAYVTGFELTLENSVQPSMNIESRVSRVSKATAAADLRGFACLDAIEPRCIRTYIALLGTRRSSRHFSPPSL
jgi:hypothetical protein